MAHLKNNVLLIGYDEHLCLSIVYCLRNSKLNIHLLTHNKKSVCKFSRYIDRVFYYDNYSDLPQAIDKVADEIDLDLIVPYDELESLYVSKYSIDIEKTAPVVPITDPEFFEKAINKNDLNDYLTARNISVMPKSVTLSSTSSIEDLDGLKLPILLKPARSSFGRGIVTIKSSEELREFFDNNSQDLTGFAAQEFIEGSDITCNIYAIVGQIKHHTIQESPVKGVNNYAKNDDLIYHDDQQVFEMVSDIAKALNWNGIACVDLRRDAQTGQVYLLEINGRFWGSVSGSYDKANVNFPLIMINDALYKRETTVEKKEGIQVSVSQLVKEMKKLQFKNLTKTKYQSYFYDPLARFLKYMPR